MKGKESKESRECGAVAKRMRREDRGRRERSRRLAGWTARRQSQGGAQGGVTDGPQESMTAERRDTAAGRQRKQSSGAQWREGAQWRGQWREGAVETGSQVESNLSTQAS